jgi:hypothetical protein
MCTYFNNTSLETKLKPNRIEKSFSTGYSTEIYRELYDYTRSSAHKEEFDTIIQEYEEMSFNLAKDCITQIFYSIGAKQHHNGLQYEEKNLVSTLLRMTFATADTKSLDFGFHSDDGLCTLIPICEPGLLLLKQDFSKVDAYDGSTHPYFLLICGEILSKITCGYFLSAMHRVSSRIGRFSCPYFYFVDMKNSLLDWTLLESSVIDDHVKAIESLEDSEFFEPIDAGTFDQILAERLETTDGSEVYHKIVGNYKRGLYWKEMAKNVDFEVKREENDPPGYITSLQIH